MCYEGELIYNIVVHAGEVKGAEEYTAGMTLDDYYEIIATFDTKEDAYKAWEKYKNGSNFTVYWICGKHVARVTEYTLEAEDEYGNLEYLEVSNLREEN